MTTVDFYPEFDGPTDAELINWAEANEYNDEYPDFSDDFEELPPVDFCGDYAIHESHVYVALNRNVYLCYGMTQDVLDDLDKQANAEPCEHGLSAALCGGPMHWYD